MYLYRLLSICIFCMVLGCEEKPKSSNNHATFTQTISDFTSINIEGNIKATIAQSDDQNSYIIINQKDLAQLNISVSENTLFIKSKQPIRLNKIIPEISIQTHNLEKINTTGSNKINLNELNAKHFNISNKGSSKFNISGKIADLDINTSGAILVNGKSLKTNNSTIKSTGVCHLLLEVADNLQINSNGFNKILYKGDPNVDNQGSGYNIIKPLNSHEIV